MSLSHSFDVKVACAVGERKAVIITNFGHWHLKNACSIEHVHDGSIWTYNTYQAFTRVWPYLSEKEVRTALEGLEKEGYLITGNYNKWRNDRTKWYALTEKACALLDIEFAPDFGLPKWANANAQMGRRICPNRQIDLPQRAEHYH